VRQLKLPSRASRRSCRQQIRHRVVALSAAVAKAHPRDRDAVLFWAAGKIRDMRRAGLIEFPDVVVALDTLRQTALQGGLTAWATERAIATAMMG
jgi:hypothetical protein